MALYARAHDAAIRPRMRVWTTEMRTYGQFTVITHEEFNTFCALLERILGKKVRILKDSDMEEPGDNS